MDDGGLSGAVRPVNQGERFDRYRLGILECLKIPNLEFV
jgi:hypothetical protein